MEPNFTANSDRETPVQSAFSLTEHNPQFLPVLNIFAELDKIPSDKMMEYVKSVVKVRCDDIWSFDIQGFKKQISSMSVEEVNDYLSLIN